MNYEKCFKLTSLETSMLVKKQGNLLEESVIFQTNLYLLLSIVMTQFCIQ